MAVTVRNTGACKVQLNTGSAGAWQDLGYSDNGLDVAVEDFLVDVPGDENGGNAGPPIDVQTMGQVVRISGTLTKFDADVGKKVIANAQAGTAGVIQTPGTFLFQGSKTFQMRLLNAAGEGTLYSRVIFRGARSFNVGSRYQEFRFQAEAHHVSGTIYTDVTP